MCDECKGTKTGQVSQPDLRSSHHECRPLCSEKMGVQVDRWCAGDRRCTHMFNVICSRPRRHGPRRHELNGHGFHGNGLNGRWYVPRRWHGAWRSTDGAAGNGNARHGDVDGDDEHGDERPALWSANQLDRPTANDAKSASGSNAGCSVTREVDGLSPTSEGGSSTQSAIRCRYDNGEECELIGAINGDRGESCLR